MVNLPWNRVVLLWFSLNFGEDYYECSKQREMEIRNRLL